jgi:hypothetical protein
MTCRSRARRVIHSSGLPSTCPAPLLGPATPDSGLGVAGFIQGGFFQGKRYLSSLANRWALYAKALSSLCLITDGPHRLGTVSPTRHVCSKGQLFIIIVEDVSLSLQ